MKEVLLRDSSFYNINKQIEQKLLHYKRSGERPLNPLPTILLPVVVHIIHNNGSENISNARVLAGIQHLNEAYANTGYYDPSSGINTNIQFCLVQRDANNLATTGITRNVSTYTNMGGTNYDSDDITVKNINRWNPNCYINIWLVNNIPGPVAGYAYLPAAHGMNMDGILMEAAFWGSGYSNDVVIIHEMGHYLGLYHTFEQGCTNNDCTTDGDKVCDTPPDNSTSVTSCDLTVNSCATDVLSGFTTDQNDLTRDYLDYGNWDCMSVFTQGQADRMNWYILNVRSSLMHCNSCLPPCPTPLTANFTSSTNTALAGTNVSFTNKSANGISYSWYVNDVMVSNAFNYNQVFTKQGKNIIKLVVESGDPAFCLPQEKVDSVKITCSTHASFTPGYNGVAVIGQNINFINTSTNASSYEWYYDNSLVATSANYTAAFNTLGIHYIKLKAVSLYCTDSMPVYYLLNAPSSQNFSFQKRYSFTGISSNITERNQCLILPDQSIIQICDNQNLGNTVIKLTETGNVIWSKKYLNNSNPFGPYINLKKALFTKDGNMVLLGDAYIGSTAPGIIKTDLNGNIIWKRFFYEPASVSSTDIIELTDGSYIISGDYYYGYLIFYKIDKNGSLLWRKSLAYGDFDFLGASLLLNANEVYFSCSIRDRQVANSLDGFIMKINPLNADIIFGKKYGNTGIVNWFTKIGAIGNKLVVEGSLEAINSTPQPRKTLLLTDLNGSVKDFKLINFPNINASRFDAGLFVDSHNKILLPLSESGTFDSHVLVLDSGLAFIKGKTFPQTVIITPNNNAEFSNGDFLLSQTMDNYYTALIRTLPDLSLLPCNSSGFIPDIQSGTLTVTDISDRLVYGGNFPQIDSVLDISSQNINTVSQTDCDNIINPSCDTSLCKIYRLSGPEQVCHLNDTVNILLNKNLNCSLKPTWTITGTAGYVILSQTDSLVKVKATSSGRILVKAKSMSVCKISEDSIAIDVNISSPEIDLGQDIMLCSASTIKLNAGSGFKSYLWQDRSVDSTFTAYLPGTYYVIVIDYCENHYGDSININLAPAVPFDLGPDREICANDSISISAPAGFSNYDWSPDYFLDTPYGQIIKVWPGVDTIYTVTAIKAMGCSVLDSIKIKVHPVKKINLGNDTSLCQGTSIDLNAGANFISYQWNTGSTNQSVTAYAAGMYSVAAIDDNGCKSKDTLSILNVFTNPVNLGNDKNLCQNDSLVLNAGNGFRNYSWQDNSVKQTFIVHTTGQFWVKVKDENNCIFSDTIGIINIVPDPTINLGADTGLCEGESLLLSPGNDFIKYTWQDNSHNKSFTASQQGEYSVMVTDTNNCAARDTVVIFIVYPKPKVSIGNDTVLCKGQSVLLDAGNGFAQYLWQDNSDGRFFNAFATGYYQVRVTDNTGCFNIDTFRIINVITPPENFVRSTYNICEHRKEYIKPIGRFNSYLWSDGTTSDSVLILAQGNYWLRVKDTYGCEAKESFDVVEKNCTDALYFPNAFTPNNDNLNDSFQPKAFGDIEQYHLEIYDRYGKKVFESNDIVKGWNGDSDNFHETTGVYVWICEFKFKNQLREIRKGSLILIR